MQRLRKMKGFTLIELIVVVIIIGVLAAVSAIAYNKFVGDSKAKTAMANAKNVAQKLSAEAASSADGNTKAFVNGLADTAAVGTKVGIDSSVSLETGAVAAGTDTKLNTADDVWTAGAIGTAGALKVSTGADHFCYVSLGEVASLMSGTCK